MRFIPTKVHGVLDYVVAIALIFAPLIFGFSSSGGAAVVIPIVLGIGLFVYSLFTQYELGLVKLIKMPVHLVFDVVASLFLIASPFLLGFINEALNAWLPTLRSASQSSWRSSSPSRSRQRRSPDQVTHSSRHRARFSPGPSEELPPGRSSSDVARDP